MCFDRVRGSKEQRDRDKQISFFLHEAKKDHEQKVKLLLLGAGDSGKSTCAKQMKIIHLNGFTAEERLSYKSTIYGNVIDNMRSLLEAVVDVFMKEILHENKEAGERIKKLSDEDFQRKEQGLSNQVVKDIKALWRDPSIQLAAQNAGKFQFNDSAEYFFKEIDRLAHVDYVPSVQDVLNVRRKTTGITEMEFKIGKTIFNLTDVGGQRSERRKWIHCFQGVTGIIFCASLSEYDQVLFEDGTTNRMHEAIQLFKDVCGSIWFRDTAIILFLNKDDLFQKKILKVPLNVCFPEYTGANQYEEASNYIEQRFLSQNRDKSKSIFVRKTTATDTDNVRVVFNAVQNVILNDFLNRLGMGVGGSSAGIERYNSAMSEDRIKNKIQLIKDQVRKAQQLSPQPKGKLIESSHKKVPLGNSSQRTGSVDEKGRKYSTEERNEKKERKEKRHRKRTDSKKEKDGKHSSSDHTAPFPQEIKTNIDHTPKDDQQDDKTSVEDSSSPDPQKENSKESTEISKDNPIKSDNESEEDEDGVTIIGGTEQRELLAALNI